MLSDEAVVARLSRGLAPAPSPLTESLGLQWWATVVGRRDGRVDLEIVQDGRTTRAWIALPESGRPMPWFVGTVAADAREWVHDLAQWLDEQLCAGAFGPDRALDTSDGPARVVVDGYGFRCDDAETHRRLRADVGPHGWSRAGSRADFRRQYAAEWALDEAERDLGAHQRDVWSLTSPEGVAVEVTGDRSDTGTVHLTAYAGRHRRESGRRRITTGPRLPQAGPRPES